MISEEFYFLQEMAGMRFVQAESYPELESRLKLLDDPEQYKLIAVKYDALKGTQYKRIANAFAVQYKLLASDYIKDMFEWNEAKGKDVLQSMYADVFGEASVAWMNHMYIIGGQTGYLAGRFFKTTREKPEDISDFVCESSNLPQGSLVIVDTDLNERITAAMTQEVAPAAMAQGDAPPLPPRKPASKRPPVNDTVFESAEPEANKQRTDVVAVTDVDWSKYGNLFTHLEVKDAKSVEIVKLLSDHYEYQIMEEREQSAITNTALERGLHTERQNLYQLQQAIMEEEQKTSVEIQKRDEKLGQQSTLLQKREVEILELKQMVLEDRSELTRVKLELNQISELRTALNTALEESRVRAKDLLEAKKELLGAKEHIQRLEIEISTLKNSAHNAPIGQKLEFADNNPFSPTYKMSVSSLPKPRMRSEGAQEQVTIMTESSFSETELHQKETNQNAPILAPLSTDAPQEQATKNSSSGNKHVSIAKYGIRCWQEDDCSLIEHLGAVTVGLDVAREAGVTSKASLMSLVFQSLPQKHSWAREFIDPKKEPEEAMTELIEVLLGDTSQLLNDFMKVQKKRDEPLLQYFCKLRRTYAYASSKKMSELDSDQVACKLIVQKLKEALETNLAAELARRIELDAAGNNLTMKKLADVLLRISHLMPETSWSHTVAPVSNNTSSSKNCTICGKPNHTAERCWKTKTCTKCNKVGHIRRFCAQKFTNAAIGADSREGETSGISDSIAAIDFSKIICHLCKKVGHIKRYCTEKGKSE